MAIPLKLREDIDRDPFMKRCVYQDLGAPNHTCRGRITWEHAWIYNGKQIQAKWAIIPCCENHNSGEAMVKEYNQYRALIRADIEMLKIKYPRTDWEQELKYLKNKYGN